MYGLAARGDGSRYRMAVELHARGARGFWYRLDGWHRYAGQTFATLAEVTQDPSCVAIQVSWGAAAALASWEGEDEEPRGMCEHGMCVYEPRPALPGRTWCAAHAPEGVDGCPDCGSKCRPWLRGERCGELLPPSERS